MVAAGQEMGLQKRPESRLVNADAIHALKNSLDRSFADPGPLSSGTDLLNSRYVTFTESLCVTSPKEISFGIYQLEKKEEDAYGYCVKARSCCSFTDQSVNYDSISDDSRSHMAKLFNRNQKKMEEVKNVSVEEKREMNLSIKSKLNVNSVNKKNSMEAIKRAMLRPYMDEVDTIDVLSDLGGFRSKKCSTRVIEKKKIEQMNFEKKKLMRRIMNKNMMDGNETEKMNLDKQNKGKMAMDRLDKDETLLKQYFNVDDGTNEKEKGSLEVEKTQKEWVDETMEGCGKLKEKDDYIDEFCDKAETENASDEIKKDTEEIVLNEKWLDEEQEKSERMNTTKRNKPGTTVEMERKNDVKGKDIAQSQRKDEVQMKEAAEFQDRDTSKEMKIALNSTPSCQTKAKREISEIGDLLLKTEQPPGTEIKIKEILETDDNISLKVCRNLTDVNELKISGGRHDFSRVRSCSETKSRPSAEQSEEKSALCLSAHVSFEISTKFRNYHGSLIVVESFPSMSWICVSGFAAEVEPTDASYASHGDNRNSRGSSNASSPSDRGGVQGSFSGSPFGCSSNGGGGGVGGFGSSGNGGGRDGNDEWANRRPLESSNEGRKRKARKKLKRKCWLEHGKLTGEQISIVIGWLLQQKSQSVPDTLSEMLKCVNIFLKNKKYSGDDDCLTCTALVLMLKHWSSCPTKKCRRCDGVLTLFAWEHQNSLCIMDGKVLLSPNVRNSGMEILRRQFSACSSSSEDDLASGSGSDESSASESPSDIRQSDFEGENLPPRIVELERQPSPPVIQGPPETDLNGDEQCFSEYLPPSKLYYPSLSQQNQPRNYSLPADTHNARSGSVIYGSKDLLRALAVELQKLAEEQRSDKHDGNARYKRHRLTSNRVGVILQNQASNLRIQSNNYELDEEWTFVIDKALGTGVSGSCFAGSDGTTDFSFCVKKIPLHKFYSDEVLIWLDMEHPDIVELYGIIAYESYVFILQELIRGPTLKEYISTKKALDSFEALTYMYHLLMLLIYLKKKEVIHNDIKADNLLVRGPLLVCGPMTSTRLVLIDFGLASRTAFVQAGVSPVGGQTHWSPEKAASEGYGHPADVWAAVAVFVHMLSGTEPWCVRFRNAAYLHRIIKQQSPPLEDVPDYLPPQVHGLIVEGWTVSPDARPSASKLLCHEAFRLLDSCHPSTELFSSHLSVAGTSEIEIANSEAILEESDTEELISLALNLQQQVLSSVGSPSESIGRYRRPSGSDSCVRPSTSEARNNSMTSSMTSSDQRFTSRPFTSSERHFSLTTLSSLHVLPPVEEEQTILTESILESLYRHQETPRGEVRQHNRTRKSVVDLWFDDEDDDDDDRDDLFKKYDDISLSGYCLMLNDPHRLRGISPIPEESQSCKPDDPSTRTSSVLHRVELLRDIPSFSSEPEQSFWTGLLPSAAASATAAAPPSIPAVVEEFVLSSDEEHDAGVENWDRENVVHLCSNEDEGDLVDSSRKAFVASASLSRYNLSLGTTLRMYLDGSQVYCIHLHPGTECTWSQAVLRASTEIHKHDVVAFTAELRHDDQAEPIDLTATIPSMPEIRLVIVPLNAFQSSGWTWKVEDGRLIYHPDYQGNFGPQFY